jgi:hypothetical protein
MSDQPELPEGLPPGFRAISIRAEEIDFLMHYWELRDHTDVIGWAVRLLHDLSRADEMGFVVAMMKGDVQDDKVVLVPITTIWFLL